MISYARLPFECLGGQRRLSSISNTSSYSTACAYPRINLSIAYLIFLRGSYSTARLVVSITVESVDLGESNVVNFMLPSPKIFK